MRLLKLSANKESFRTVIFNKEGISLITGRKKSSSNSDTYNSVGKSLMIFLIHFCLGSRKSEALEECLPDWKFRLDFEIESRTHYCRRSTNAQNKIEYDGEEYNVNDFNKKLGSDVFKIDNTIKGLSFRHLISRFVRNGKQGYVSFNHFLAKEQDDTALVNTSFLLGLDTQLVITKMLQKEAYTNIQNQEKDLKKDSTLRNVFLNNEIQNVDVEIVKLEREIAKLSDDINNFEIASDYGNVKKEADAISQKRNAAVNESFKYKMFIENIDKSLNSKPDVSKDRLISFFNEANVHLSDSIVKQINDVEIFNKRLIDDRFKVLQQQKQNYLKLFQELEQKIIQLEKEENKRLQYLNSHGALEDFTQLTNYLTDKKMSLDRLNHFKEVHSQFSVRKEEIKKQMADENIKTQQYLDAKGELTKSLLSFFHDLANSLYGEKGAALTIENNDGENRIRYNIEAHIPADAGDGVSSAKLFCFDWTLMKATNGKFCKFLIHDSRLVSDTDTRQIATMLRVAKEECSELHCQYILTLNESTIENLRKEFTPEEFEKIVVNNQVLELNDDSDVGKLLGIQVDLKYE